MPNPNEKSEKKKDKFLDELIYIAKDYRSGDFDDTTAIETQFRNIIKRIKDDTILREMVLISEVEKEGWTLTRYLNTKLEILRREGLIHDF